MARIRTIKPEFWSDDKLGPLDPLTRLVFLGLVSQADDAGRLPDSVKRLNGLLFPFTEDDAEPCIELLSTLGVISRGSAANGQRIIQITGWSRHQYIEKPNLRAALPPIVPPSKVRRRIPDDSGNAPQAVPDNSPGEVEVEVEGINRRTLGEDPDPRAHEVASLEGATATPDFDGYQPNDAQRARAAELQVDLDRALRSWRAKRKAKGITPIDLAADFDGWLEDQPDFERDQPGTVAARSIGPTVLPPVRWPVGVPGEREPEPTEAQKAELNRLIDEQRAKRELPPEPANGNGRLAAALGPKVPPRIDDAKAIAERDAEKQRQLAIVRRSVKT